MLQCCVCRLSLCTECIVAKRCDLEQKLQLTAYRKSHMRKSIGTKTSDHDLCLEAVLTSRQPLHHICHWITPKPFEIEAWFQRTTDMKWPMGNKMVTWLMPSRDPERLNPNTLRAQPGFQSYDTFQRRISLKRRIIETKLLWGSNRKLKAGCRMV